MPAAVRRWWPTDEQRAQFSAPGQLTWAPHTVPLTGGQWVDGAWTDATGDVTLSCDLAVEDDCAAGCLTPVEVAYGRLLYAETGGYLVVAADPTSVPTILLPGGCVTLEHTLAALRHFAVDLMGRPPFTTHISVPMYSRDDLRADHQR
jgi:hypothetical protein